MCRGEIFFALTCANDVYLPNRQTWPRHKSWGPPNVTTLRMCGGEIFFARLRVIHTPSSNHQTSPRPKSWHPPNVTTHRMCRGEIFFARPCANDVRSPNHQSSSHHKSWRLSNLTTHHGCTGEKYFAPTCAFDAPSTTRCDRAPTTRCRTTVVRAKNISPLRVPTMSDRPPFARACALGASPPRRGARLNARHRALQPGVCSTNCNLAPMQQQCRAWNASLPTPAHPAAPGQTKPSTRSCL